MQRLGGFPFSALPAAVVSTAQFPGPRWFVAPRDCAAVLVLMAVFQAAMEVMGNALKVLDAVVRSIAIDVVNVVTSGNSSVNVLPDVAMFAHLFTIHGYEFVALQKSASSLAASPLNSRVAISEPSEIMLLTPTATAGGTFTAVNGACFHGS